MKNIETFFKTVGVAVLGDFRARLKIFRKSIEMYKTNLRCDFVSILCLLF